MSIQAGAQSIMNLKVKILSDGKEISGSIENNGLVKHTGAPFSIMVENQSLYGIRLNATFNGHDIGKYYVPRLTNRVLSKTPEYSRRMKGHGVLIIEAEPKGKDVVMRPIGNPDLLGLRAVQFEEVTANKKRIEIRLV